MKKSVFLYILIIIINSSSNCQVYNKIPFGLNILPNGILENSEWSDSKTTQIDSTVLLKIKQDSIYVYIGIKFLNEKHSGIDLYISDHKDYKRMLHISSTLASKQIGNYEWGKVLWELQAGWTGNTVGIYYDENGKMKIIEPDGFEIQICKSFLKTTELRLRFHLKRPEKVLPEHSSENNSGNWYKYYL